MNGAEQSRIDRRDRAQRRRRHGMRVHDSARTLALLQRDVVRRGSRPAHRGPAR